MDEGPAFIPQASWNFQKQVKPIRRQQQCTLTELYNRHSKLAHATASVQLSSLMAYLPSKRAMHRFQDLEASLTARQASTPYKDCSWQMNHHSIDGHANCMHGKLKQISLEQSSSFATHLLAPSNKAWPSLPYHAVSSDPSGYSSPQDRVNVLDPEFPALPSDVPQIPRRVPYAWVRFSIWPCFGGITSIVG